MAKALVGHIGGPDARMVAEMRRLQQRVRDLEGEIVRLQAANDTLSAAVSHHEEAHSVASSSREPALT